LQLLISKFIETLTTYILHIREVGIFKPISARNAASMVLITAEAALLQEGIIKQFLLVICQLNT
jgi:hypothetical protein